MKTSIYIDSNLLVLLIVGSVDRNLIAKHRRTKGYNVDDFGLLDEILGNNPKIVLIPNVVAETSNLLRFYGDPDRSRLVARLGYVANYYSELYIASKDAASLPEFVQYGCTDAALLIARSESSIILTDDFHLYKAAERRELPHVYFTHERERRGIV